MIYNDGAGELVAGILVGGASRRMGTPKPLLRFQGQTFIEHAVDMAGTVAQAVVLLGQPPDCAALFSHLQRLSDPPDAAGPAAGLCALLEYATGPWSLLLACDMPLVDRNLLKTLVDHATHDVDVVLFAGTDPGMDHVCCALYHARVLATTRTALARGEYSLQSIVRSLSCRRLIPSSAEARRLININTPDDYARLCDCELS